MCVGGGMGGTHQVDDEGQDNEGEKEVEVEYN